MIHTAAAIVDRLDDNQSNADICYSTPGWGDYETECEGES